MDTSESESFSSSQPKTWKCKRTSLTVRKKFRCHLSTEKIPDDLDFSSAASSAEISTQVMPLKVKAFGNQTLSSETCTSSTSTAEPFSQDISVQTIQDNIISHCAELPVRI